ncbi:Protein DETOXIFICATION 29 [Turnera subulata]|uniref:Protein DETOXIFICATION 29 n=1 Tax=Turnera subulata TaxID=218843 RepID=A0A9Q0GAQ5_9ROSI|nr:Protein DETOXIFICATION 29 [Turnera subulata]
MKIKISGIVSKKCKKIRYLAAPTVFTSLCQYSFGAITQVFSGHVVILELASVSVENSVIADFSFGVMLAMGSVLETLCGQALFPDLQLGMPHALFPKPQCFAF